MCEIRDVGQVVLLSFLIFLISCGGISDDKYDLGEGYFLLNNGPTNRYIYFGENQIEEEIILPTVVDYDYDNQHIIVLQQPEKNVYKNIISRRVLNKHLHYSLLNNEQKLSKSIFSKETFNSRDSIIVQHLANLGFTGDLDKKDLKIIATVSDSIIGNEEQHKLVFENQFNIWVINKLDGKVHGPLKSTEYKQKLVELGVSNSLKLQFPF